MSDDFCIIDYLKECAPYHDWDGFSVTREDYTWQGTARDDTFYVYMDRPPAPPSEVSVPGNPGGPVWETNSKVKAGVIWKLDDSLMFAVYNRSKQAKERNLSGWVMKKTYIANLYTTPPEIIREALQNIAWTFRREYAAMQKAIHDRHRAAK